MLIAYKPFGRFGSAQRPRLRVTNKCKMKKFIARLKWHIKELVKTFSHQPSYYSSKRIERAIIFINANAMLDVGTYFLMKEHKVGAIELVTLYTAQMIYAGYQTKQIFNDPKEKVINGADSNTTT